MSEKEIDIRFQEAVTIASNMEQSTLPQDEQLRLYAYYKQATSGIVESNRHHSNFDLRNAFKINAWMQISHLTPDEAKEEYIQAINNIIKDNK